MRTRLFPALVLVLVLGLIWGGVVEAANPHDDVDLVLGQRRARDAWLTRGNAGTDPSINFLGTTDNVALALRTNSLERVRVLTNGRVGIGTAAPNEQLEITGNLRLPATTATAGIIRSGADTLIHAFGTSNFFAGVNAGNLAMAGYGNTGLGGNALRANTTGLYNTAAGGGALIRNTTGSRNTATGESTLVFNTTGDDNTAAGQAALVFNTTGNRNTATGSAALQRNTTGVNNTADGSGALVANTTGSENTAVGVDAGGTCCVGNGTATGSRNTFVGALSRPSTSTELNNATAIGYGAQVGASNALVLGGTGASAVSVGIGTTTPRSTLQVVGNYIQFPTITGSAPPAADCNAVSQAGRIVVRTDGTTNLYICTGTGGWVGK